MLTKSNVSIGEHSAIDVNTLRYNVLTLFFK